jgi:hypothetical protein
VAPVVLPAAVLAEGGAAAGAADAVRDAGLVEVRLGELGHPERAVRGEDGWPGEDAQGHHLSSAGAARRRRRRHPAAASARDPPPFEDLSWSQKSERWLAREEDVWDWFVF